MTKLRKIKKISIPAPFIEELSRRFACTKQTIYAALKYELTSDKADEIRRMAKVEFGGVDVVAFKKVAL